MNVIGIDLGGTNIRGAIVNSKGKILNYVECKAEARKGRAQVMDNIVYIVSLLKKFAIKNRIKLTGMGIGAPGFTMKNGKRTSIKNIPGFMNYKLEYALKKRIGKFTMENDANCFALAETKHGAAKNKKNVIGVITGTGLGLGLILNGKLFTGTTGGAGELNHSLFCVGKNYSFGLFCSANGLRTRYKQKTGKTKTAKEIFFSKGKIEKKLINDLHHYLALFLSYVVNLLEPEIIVIGGGLSGSLDYKKLRRLIKRFKYEGMFMPKVVKHKLKHAGLIGAADLVL